MTPQQFQRVKSLFAELEAVPADERRRALDARSGDDPVVRAEAARLLEPDDAADQPKVVYDKPFGQSDPIAREYIIAPDGRPLIVEASERRPTVSRVNVITDWYQLLP